MKKSEAKKALVGKGPVELRAGDLAAYDGSKKAVPSNPGRKNAAFLVTLVRKQGS